MKNVIYKIRNVTNDHYYVGSTVDSRKRFWEHRKDLRTGKHVCVRLQRAWNKYGEDCFKFEIVEQLSSRDELYPAEQKWLDDHYGAEYCYNVSASADTPMRDATPEMRAHLSAKAKAWHEANEHPRLGVELTEETKQRISESRIAKTSGPNHYRYGKPVSDETKAKISAAQKGVPKAPGRKVSPEGLAKIQANIKAGKSHGHWAGRKHTKETRVKMSKAVIAIMPTGSELHMQSITHLRIALDLTPPTVNRALKSGKPITRGKFAGWVFKYVDPTTPA
jgi:group I intron endonuclease